MQKVVSFFALVLMAAATPAWAKPPVVNRFFPAGLAIGSEVTLEMAGSFDDWPVEATSHPPGLELAAAGDKILVKIVDDGAAT